MPTCPNLCLHMPTCLDLCSPHALYYLPCACALHAMFVCLDLGYVCHAMCYYSPFVSFIAFSCVLAFWFEPDLESMVLVIIHTPNVMDIIMYLANPLTKHTLLVIRQIQDGFNTSKNKCSSLVLKPYKSNQETSEEVLFIKAQHISRQKPFY